MNEKARITIRAVAGAYLVFHGIKMTRGLLEEKPDYMIIYILFSIGFVIFGAIIAAGALKRYKEFGAAGKEREYTEETVEEEPQIGMREREQPEIAGGESAESPTDISAVKDENNAQKGEE